MLAMSFLYRIRTFSWISWFWLTGLLLSLLYAKGAGQLFSSYSPAFPLPFYLPALRPYLCLSCGLSLMPVQACRISQHPWDVPWVLICVSYAAMSATTV